MTKRLIPLCLLTILLIVGCGGNNPGASSESYAGGDVSQCTTEGVAAQSADADIEQMRQTIVAFRSSLSADLLTEASACLDDERFYLWHNTPNGDDRRDGIQYGDLSDEQLDLFQELLQLFLSDDGYQKVEEITFLAEGFLNTINADAWATDYYAIDLFGDPENDGSWGFQLDGHHLVLNFLVHGDHVSIVPAFIASEPVFGSHNGTEFDVFSAEREQVFALYRNLTAEENTAATTTGDEQEMVVGPAERVGNPDPYIGDYDYSGFETGLRYSDMSAVSQSNLTTLMQTYVYNLETPFADVWWADIMSDIDNTYFVWVSETDELTNLSTYYYRIYNPHVWIEYNIEGAIGGDVEDGNHAHSITRIPSNSAGNGGDYGIFAHAINQSGPRTLLEHYMAVDHHLLSEIEFDYTLSDVGGHAHDS